MKNLILVVAVVLSFQTKAQNEEFIYVTIGSDAVSGGQKSMDGFEVISDSGEIAVVKLDPKNVENLSNMMHENHNRCGGFIHHSSLADAMDAMNSSMGELAKNFLFTDYSINQANVVSSFIEQVDEFQIRSSILTLSNFHNRHYKSQTGVDSQAWVKSKWETLSSGRSDVSVEYFQHDEWPQPSVIMTIEGSSKSDEIVIIGGHGDSIAKRKWPWDDQSKLHAPGADDNASGISTITEVIRIAMANGYKPEKTVKFMSYAAEEVGMLGSIEIADSFKRQNKNVVGVLQLDMTNFKGDNRRDILFMTDFTNEAQNKFLAKLLDTYIQIPWGHTRCGYACSDHVSWYRRGYPTSMPSESTMDAFNPTIHTKDDHIDVSNGTADQAVKFAKLALAYLVEIAD